MLTYFPRHAAPRGGEANEGAARCSALQLFAAVVHRQARAARPAHLVALLYGGPPSLVVFPLGPSVQPGWEDEKARGCCLFCKYRVLVVLHLGLFPLCFLVQTPELGSQQLSTLGRNPLFSQGTSSTLGKGAERKTPGCGRGRVESRLPLLPSGSGGAVLITEGPLFCPYRAFFWSLNLLSESPGIPGLTPPPTPNTVCTQYTTQ